MTDTTDSATQADGRRPYRPFRTHPEGATRARMRVFEEALSVMLTREMFSPEARRLAEGVLNGDSAVIAEVRQLFAEDPLEGPDMRSDLGFHSKDGYHFKRQDDGSVRICLTTADGEDIVEEVTLDGMTWASVVASVSYRGENGMTYNEAILFHSGPVQNVAPDAR